jgi:hypothetical protein
MNPSPKKDLSIKQVTMKSILMVIAAVLPLTFWGQNFKNRTTIGEDSATKTIKNILSDNSYKLPSDTLIKDKETAIALAETVLFKSYGKALIAGEKPYESYLIDGYWYLRGTLPKNSTGDVFEMIIGAKDGRIIKMSHGAK